MKKLYTYFVLALLTLALVSATVSAKEKTEETCGQGVGSIDCECQANGYDFGVAKYECDDGDYDLDDSIPGYNINLEGNCQSANWTSHPGVAGVVVKAATVSNTFDGGASGNFASWDKHDISHATFCGERSNGGGGHEVPEFSTVTLGAAALVAVLGLAYLRKQ